MENIEIEKKFLINNIPFNITLFPHVKIMQGYISVSPDGTEVRLRKRDRKFFLTVKSAGGISRKEVEIKISEEQFGRLWLFTEGRRIFKTRYNIKYDNYLIEVDCYEDDLKGFMVAEVEFKNEKDMAGFRPLEWFGKDISDDDRYKNKNLALYGFQYNG